MDSIDLAQDRDQWRALVNTVILGSSWVAAQLATFQEGLSSMSEWVTSTKNVLNSFDSLHGTNYFQFECFKSVGSEVFAAVVMNSSFFKTTRRYTPQDRTLPCSYYLVFESIGWCYSWICQIQILATKLYTFKSISWPRLVCTEKRELLQSLEARERCESVIRLHGGRRLPSIIQHNE
jgi:hypothetical protein